MRKLVIVAAASLIFSMVGEADAFWGCGYGSWGGCWGGYGSYGYYGYYGGYGCWGGCGLVRARCASYGCYDCCGCTGCYQSMAYPSCGCGGCVGSCGSVCESPADACCGTTVVTEGAVEGTEVQPEPAPAEPVPAEETGAPADQEARVPADGALLAVSVPPDATVFVNGYRTSSTGAARQFLSSGLQGGRSYTYEVRAVAKRSGEEVTQTEFVTLRAGGTARVAFDLQRSDDVVKTVLTLHVPENAKVELAGTPTGLAGTTRVFTTSQLEAGQEWTDYTIRVSLPGEDSMLSKVETITVRGGETRELTFEFDEQRTVAAR